MNNIVDNLKKLCKQHEKHLSDLRQRINEIEYYPLAKSMVGRCFKVPMGYSSFGFFGGVTTARVRSKNTGYIYKRVIGYIQDYIIVDTFEIHRVGKIEITFHEKEHVSYFANKSYIPITKKQYFNAFNKMVKHIFETGKKEK